MSTPSTHPLSRRRFLRGLGTCIALPALESLLPVNAACATEVTAPTRAAFIYVPNGSIMDRWKPKGEGSNFQLGQSARVLQPHQEHLQVLTGLMHEAGTPGPDGAGSHARANSTFLTSSRPRKTAGADILLGTSIDQAIANQIGGQTRLPSLELSCDASRKSGTCDSGYSCAYQFNMSWSSPTQPIAAETNPRLAFERLFGNSESGKKGQRKSILDFVQEDARSLHRQLGKNDQAKLDEYLTGIRAVEESIEKTERMGAAVTPKNFPIPPAEIPDQYEQHIRLMFDLMAVAFETDSTRVSSFCLAHDGSNRQFPSLDIHDGHHNISHHRDQKENIEKLIKIDEFYLKQLAYFLDQMKARKTPDGRSLLDQSMIVWGSGLSDANSHIHEDLPIILAGGGSGIQTGRHLKSDRTPMANLYLSMAEKMGVSMERFGDSTGKLSI